jgi:hypothetical protein
MPVRGRDRFAEEVPRGTPLDPGLAADGGGAGRLGSNIREGGSMLDYGAIGRIPESIALNRNGKVIAAARKRLGTLRVINRTLRIADAEMIHEFPPLPVGVKNGEYEVYAYEWSHSRGPVNVCAVVLLRQQRWAISRRLTIRNNIRPDLTEGLFVDFGAVSIESDNLITLTAGLGDGYYPVFAIRNFGVFLQSIIVDFKIWKLPNLVLLPGQKLDEYGMVVST